MLEKIYKNDLKQVGNAGEDVACEYLERKGYEIIERNFSCHQGEIDIIARKEKEYIFCEVKTRRNNKYGNGIDAVTPEKQNHIWNTARYYLYKNNLYNNYIRFDVIEVFISNGYNYINHVKNVMQS